MKATLALLADYANISQEGKLNILGTFQEINAPALPYVLPQMYLVVSFEAGPAEFGSEKHMRIALLDSDGNEALALEGDALVPQASPGRKAYINEVIGLNGVKFDRAGDYAFSILVGGDEKATVPLYVNDLSREGESDQ